MFAWKISPPSAAKNSASGGKDVIFLYKYAPDAIAPGSTWENFQNCNTHVITMQMKKKASQRVDRFCIELTELQPVPKKEMQGGWYEKYR